MSGVELVVVEDAESAATRAAGLLAEAARRGGHIAFSGGSTPRRAYALAAALEPDWSRVDAWLADERCVPADDDRANTRLLRETLLDHAGAPPRLHPVETALAPAEAAVPTTARSRTSTSTSCSSASARTGTPPRSSRRRRRSRRRTRSPSPRGQASSPWVERVTMTIPMLASAREVVFLVVGAEKAEAARRAFREPPTRATPSSLVRSANGRTIAILDREAAAALDS